jgi:hypothetical protein
MFSNNLDTQYLIQLDIDNRCNVNLQNITTLGKNNRNIEDMIEGLITFLQSIYTGIKIK